MTQGTCCVDLSFHKAHEIVIDRGFPGVAMVVLRQGHKFAVPLNYCPWCGAELRPQSERTQGSYYPR